MVDPKGLAQRMLDRQAQTFLKAGDQLVEHTLGRCVKEMLLAGKPLSRAGLLAWLQAGIAASASAKGKLPPEQDPARQLFEGALRFLESVPPESAGSDCN